MQGAAEHLDPLAHADQALARAGCPLHGVARGVALGAGDLDRDPAIAVGDAQPGGAAAGMLEGVGEGLLHHAVDRQIDGGPERLRPEVHLRRIHREPGAPEAIHEGRDVSRGRIG